MHPKTRLPSATLLLRRAPGGLAAIVLAAGWVAVVAIACEPVVQSAEPSDPSPLTADRSVVRDLAAELEPIRAEFHLPALACAVLRSNQIIAVGWVGVRQQGSSDPVTLSDRWHHGSLTKSMTATLAGVLVEEGRIGWATTLAEAFPREAATMHRDWRTVTLEQLLAHRGGAPSELDSSGIWKQLWDRRDSPRAQRLFLLRHLTALSPAATPGTRYLYSNAGYALAGAMLEEATDRSWEDLMRERVFQPLEMTSAGFGAPEDSATGREPWGHAAGQSFPEPMAPGPRADNPPAVAPAGEVHSSLLDLARFAAAHVAGERGGSALLSAATYKRLHDDSAHPGYALGWVVGERSWAGGRTLSHTGSNTYWYTNVWLAPNRDFTMVIVTNLGGERASQATDVVASRLLALFLD